MLSSPALHQALLTVLLAASQAFAVMPLPAGNLIERRANFFDLDQKLLRFTPGLVLPTGYKVELEPSFTLLPQGNLIGPPSGPFLRGYSSRVQLLFPFPFAGATWTDIYVNSNGNLTFGNPETALYPQRETWADGTMRHVAAALDVRSIAGQERMIAPLWALYSWDIADRSIYLRSTAGELIVTWISRRYRWPNEGYDPLGVCSFQVRLTPNGVIEFRYQGVAERDGIVGVFTGQSAAVTTLDYVDHNPAQPPNPSVAVRAIGVFDAGSAIRFSFTLAEPVPANLASGNLYYRMFLTSGGERCEVGYHVGQGAPIAYTSCPAGVTSIVSGTRLDLLLSKLAFMSAPTFSWGADVLRVTPSSVLFDQVFLFNPRTVTFPTFTPSGQDLSVVVGEIAGNIFEVFHYPFVRKSRGTTLRSIYQRVPPADEMAVIFTDFRIDDLHNHGSSTGGINGQIQGIGVPGYSGADEYRSTTIQVATGPIYLGPRFDYSVRDGLQTYRNYAFAVEWTGHELTHRWTAFLQSRTTMNPNELRDTYCYCHWSEWLHAPSVHPVASLFSDLPYIEHSMMGGAIIAPGPAGGFVRRYKPSTVPTGMSALDLYAAGLIPPGEVLDTTLLTGPNRTTSVPVTIADVIAAMGPRIPSAASAQRNFKLGIYLLHEDGRPPHPAKLAQARGIEAAVIQYFSAATGGRMMVTSTSPAGTPNQFRLVSGGGQTGAPAQILTDPLVFELLDSMGGPAPGVGLDFSTAGAEVIPPAPVTDERGRATVGVRFSNATGLASVIARAPGVAEVRVTFPVQGSPPGGNPPPGGALRFVSLQPCRIMETRPEYNFPERTGAFGPPFLTAGQTRTLTLPASPVCQIPSHAKAYVLNVTIVPRGPVDYVTLWPGGEARPSFRTVSAPDGLIAANAAIIKAGAGGTVSVYTSHATDAIIDISGYFTDNPQVPNLVYYPLTPCRVIDTRVLYRPAAGPFGPPTMEERETRRFRFPATPYCSIPHGAAAYSVTLTAVPPAPLAFLTAWPAGGGQPNVSSLNSPVGRIVANSVILPAGADGSIDVFVYNKTDFLADINGYFALDDGQTGLSYFPVTQCRVSDTSNPAYGGVFGGPAYGNETTRTLPVQASPQCPGIPASAKAYALNVTAFPGGSPMPFLTMWPAGQGQPNASVLNAFDGQVVSNAAIIPAGSNGAVNVYTYRGTHVQLEIAGYFGR